MSSPETPTIPEEDPDKKLHDFVTGSPHIPEQEKPRLIDHHVSAPPEELRATARAVEENAHKVLSLDEIPDAIHGIARHQQSYADSLREAADHREWESMELKPEEMVQMARGIYELARQKVIPDDQYLDRELKELGEKSRISDQKRLIELCIKKSEARGSAAHRLVAFHEKLGDLTETQKLASLATNRLNAFESLRRHARSLDVAHRQDNSLTEKARELIELQFKRSEEIRYEFRVLSKAVEVLSGSVPEE